MQKLAEWNFGVEGLDDAVDLRGGLDDYARGSRNLMPDGVKQSRPFRGLQYLAAGARRQFQIKDTWGGLDDVSGQTASGSLFSTIADMLVYIGRGQVSLEGTNISGAIASNLLRFLLKFNGSYTHAKSGPYVAGLPEPSAPQFGTITDSRFTSIALTGATAVKYARLRETTGGRSRASVSSVVLTGLVGKIPFCVVPAAISGQTHHIFFAIDPKLGLGNYYRAARANPFTNAEFTEEDVERTITTADAFHGANQFYDSLGRLTAADIGKRVEFLSSGISVPPGTVITGLTSPYQADLSNNVTITTGGSFNNTAKIISYVGGIDRGIALNLQSSTLTEEVAWIYDFPPPTGSHAFQLETRMFIVGYADASNKSGSAGADANGTVLLPSISDYFESYDPRYPTYLPEAVIDVLSDGMSSYKFLGGKNGIYAAQFLNVTNSTPVTLSVLLRGEGITTPSNWCARENAIYLFSAKGRPVRITEGGVVDLSFAAKVLHKMRNWDPLKVVVSSHPEGGGVVYSCEGEAEFFDETTNRWSSELSLNDFAPGVAISSVTTQSSLILTMENGSTRTAYHFDRGTGSFVCAVGHYQNQPEPQKYKVIQKLKAEAVCDRIDKNLFVGIHANTLPTHVTDGQINSGSSLFNSASAKFTNELKGSYILIKGAGISGGFFYARIKDVLSETQLRLGTTVEDLGLSANKNVNTSVSNAYALIGLRIFPVKANRKGTIEIDSGEFYLTGAHSYAASILLETNGTIAQGLKVRLDGEIDMEDGWTLPSSAFGEVV